MDTTERQMRSDERRLTFKRLINHALLLRPGSRGWMLREILETAPKHDRGVLANELLRRSFELHDQNDYAGAAWTADTKAFFSHDIYMFATSIRLLQRLREICESMDQRRMIEKIDAQILAIRYSRMSPDAD